MKVKERFDPVIKKIETNIIEHLLKFKIFSVRGEITSKILFYFITRKDLTQAELQYLTGYSAGKISQELNNFLDLDLIKISKKSKPWVYSMDSIVLETFSRAINLLKTNVKWEPKFLEIKEQLEESKDKLQNLNGYHKIKDFIEENLRRFYGYKKVIELWEKLKIKYQAEL